MGTLLYIESSPRKKRSSSIQIAQFFLDEYEKTHPTDDIKKVDLWEKHLPSFDGDVIDAKYAIMHGQSHTEAQRKAWRTVEETINEFKSADKYVISIPMWNFGVPYTLKHYLDVIVQPSYTFNFSPSEGYKGLVVGKPITLIYARGGAYSAGEAQSLDMQKTYMEAILKFIGFNDIRSIVIEPTLSDPTEKDKTMQDAKEAATQMAMQF